MHRRIKMQSIIIRKILFPRDWNILRIYTRAIQARTKNFWLRELLCRSDLCMWLTSYLARHLLIPAILPSGSFSSLDDRLTVTLVGSHDSFILKTRSERGSHQSFLASFLLSISTYTCIVYTSIVIPLAGRSLKSHGETEPEFSEFRSCATNLLISLIRKPFGSRRICRACISRLIRLLYSMLSKV